MISFRQACIAFISIFAINNTAFASSFGGLSIEKLIVMPATGGHADWIRAIEKARSSIHLEMFHLTDKKVIDALVKKARSSNLDIKVILDGGSFKGGYVKATQPMADAGVQIRPSSKAFSLTHEKGMVIDGTTTFVTAINLTNTADNSRDFGIITSDPSVAQEVESVFATDWQNAENRGMETPALSQPNLIWSPNDSREKLVELIDSANSTLVATVESFSDSTIVEALSRAAARGVNVQIITPECSGGNGLFNFPALKKVREAGVHTHVMAGPASFNQPYMHSKMIVVDQETVYLGSVNFSYNSFDKDRELGVIFADPSTASQITSVFNQDWSVSIEPDENPSESLCRAG